MTYTNTHACKLLECVRAPLKYIYIFFFKAVQMSRINFILFSPELKYLNISINLFINALLIKI